MDKQLLNILKIKVHKKSFSLKMIIFYMKMKNILEKYIIKINGIQKLHTLLNIINFIKKFQEFS